MQLRVDLRLGRHQKSVVFPGITSDNRRACIASRPIRTDNFFFQGIIQVYKLSLIKMYVAHLRIKFLGFYKNSLNLWKEKLILKKQCEFLD
jgi:hypothetical protein